MEAKIKHLEFIQSVINRMANNSFLLKGWCTTLTSALFAATIKEAEFGYLYVGVFVVMLFWSLNGFFLFQEKLFRKLYDDIRVKREEGINFSMNTEQFDNGCGWFGAIFTKTLGIFYGGMLLIGLIIFNLI